MRAVLSLLALLAVLLMPFGMAPAAEAASQHHSASMPMPHCPEQDSQHHSKIAFAECTMACSAALPALDAAQPQSHPADRARNHVVSAHVLHGLHPETATPPPKAS